MNEWVSAGPQDDVARTETLPAFLEVEPGMFTPVGECSRAELVAAADSMMLQSKALMDEAGRLYDVAARGGLN
jgi:hypothetical protein